MFFCFQQKTAYDFSACLVGSEMGKRDSSPAPFSSGRVQSGEGDTRFERSYQDLETAGGQKVPPGCPGDEAVYTNKNQPRTTHNRKLETGTGSYVYVVNSHTIAFCLFLNLTTFFTFFSFFYLFLPFCLPGSRPGAQTLPRAPKAPKMEDLSSKIHMSIVFATGFGVRVSHKNDVVSLWFSTPPLLFF